jgi:lipoprotein-releasing system permease protein
MKLILHIALSHLTGRKRQTLVSTLGVAMGVGFSIAMAALMEGSQKDFIAHIVDYMPHVVIKDEAREPARQPAQIAYPEGAVAIRGLKPKEEIRGIKDAPGKIAELDAMPGVKAAPALRVQAFLRYGGKDVSVGVVGVDPLRERAASHLASDLTAGSIEALPGAANGLIVGAGLVKKLGLEMNSTVTVVAASGVVMKMKVVGIFRTGIISLDNSEVYTLIKKAQILYGRPNVINQIRLRLDDSLRAPEIAKQIESRWGYRSESWQESNEGILSAFIVRNMVMFATVSAILVVASFGIFNVISTVVHEKTRDIAILKSLGFSESDMRRVFLVEGLAVGLIGMLLGWALGFGLCQILGTFRFKVQFMTEMKGFMLHYSFLHYILSGGLAVISAVLAAYLPARKAAKLNPVEIIRGAA